MSSEQTEHQSTRESARLACIKGNTEEVPVPRAKAEHGTEVCGVAVVMVIME